MSNEYQPGIAICPGETITELMLERGWTPEDAAVALNLSEEEMHQVIDGKAPISMELAKRLARVFGAKEDFWIHLEIQYGRTKTRLCEEALRGIYAFTESARAGEEDHIVRHRLTVDIPDIIEQAIPDICKPKQLTDDELPF